MQLDLDCVQVAESIYDENHIIHAKVISTLFDKIVRDYRGGYSDYISDMERYLSASALCVLEDIIKLNRTKHEALESKA